MDSSSQTPQSVPATFRHDLILIYFNTPSRLLFINSSRKVESLYDAIADEYTDSVFVGLPLSKVDRVLRGLKNTRFFNIGMKNRLRSSPTESYRILSGSKADKAISETDGRLYDRGHVVGRGEDAEGAITNAEMNELLGR